MSSGLTGTSPSHKRELKGKVMDSRLIICDSTKKKKK
jgi:hypothetical protein